MSNATDTIVIPQTDDTYDARMIDVTMEQAIERAEKEGYEGGPEWLEAEPGYVAAARRQHWNALNRLWDQGKVGVRPGGPDAVVLTYRQTTNTLRGNAVAGRDYTDSLIRTRARALRDSVDGRAAAKIS